MKTLLISLFVIIDLTILAWIVKQTLDDVNSLDDALDFVIFPYLGVPYWWLYFTEKSAARRRTMRLILGAQFALVGLILIEWWVIKKMV